MKNLRLSVQFLLILTLLIEAQAAEEQQKDCVTTMKAIGYFQSLDIKDENSLKDIVVSKPEPGAKDLLVRVKAISVNPVDTKQRKRKAAIGDKPEILGWDAAGIVEAVGSDVNNFKVGDEVYYAGSILRAGANSEWHTVDERIVAKKPKNLSFENAAAIPLTGLTAYEALFDHLKLQPEENGNRGKILILGGAGGVGSMAIQMARLVGLEVITTASREDTIAWVKEKGAHIVLNHREALKPQLEKLGITQVDYIFNAVNTEEYWQQMADLIAPFGRIVSIVEASKPLDLTALMHKSASFSWELMFTRSMFQTPDMSKQNKILEHIARWLEQKKIVTTAATILEPINAANLRKAHAILESGTSIGKIVLTKW